MPKGINREHYEKIGRSLYGAGLLIFFGAPNSWQESARQRGYKEARKEWRAKHPKADELSAASARNKAFCAQALTYSRPAGFPAGEV